MVDEAPARRPAAPTLELVAAEAGVSRGTASRCSRSCRTRQRLRELGAVLGRDRAVDWRNGNWLAQLAISSIVTWRWVGYNALIYLAGMQSIPFELYESAAIDGANRWQQFVHITLPGLRPTILFTIVVSTIGATQLFGEPLLFDFGNPRGGAINQYQTIGLFMYEQGWFFFQLGKAAAVAWVMFLLILVLVLVNVWLTRLRTRESSMTHDAGFHGCDAPTEPAPSRTRRRLGAGWVTYVLLALTAILFLLPFYYMVVVGSRTMSEINQTPPPLLPGGNLWHNIQAALDQQAIGTAILNSLFVSGTVTVTTVLFSTLGGFAFAKLNFRGRNALFGFAIGTMMIPPSLGVVPLYKIMADVGLAGSLWSVILPSVITAFGIFFMRQYLSAALPDELLQAARVDGATTTRTFWSVVMPIARPGMAVLGMLTFMASWNDFFWPIIALNSTNPTVQVALNNLGGGYVPDQSIILAGTLVGTLPVLVVFALLGRQIVGGIINGAQ